MTKAEIEVIEAALLELRCARTAAEAAVEECDVPDEKRVPWREFARISSRHARRAEVVLADLLLTMKEGATSDHGQRPQR